jgi:hypothetical protein
LLPNRVLSESKPPCDFPVANAGVLELFDDTLAFGRNASATGPPSGARGESDQPSLVIAIEMAPYRAIAAAKGDGDFFLRRVAGVNQHDHGVGFCYGITHTVVVHGKARDDENTMLPLCPEGASSVDNDGSG